MTSTAYVPGLVSIGFPTYNGAKKMRPSLESLLNQTYRNTEIIISDNASTDDTAEVCREYAARDSRIRYIRQRTNLTQGQNMRFVMQSARGEYFMLAADDDLWRPAFIERLKSVLDINKYYGAAMCSVRRLYPDGEIKDTVHYADRLDLTSKTYREVFDLMASEAPIHLYFYALTRTPIIHALTRIPFPECKAHDRVFMIEMSLATSFYSLPEILLDRTAYRLHAADRYAGASIGTLFKHSKAHSKFVWAVIWRLLRSRAIPLYRKCTIYPYHLTAFVWRNRVFLREWFPKGFALALKVKDMLKQHNG